MSAKQMQASDGPVDAVIQNRLTVAGATLASLFFAGSFALSMNAQLESTHKKDFRTSFIYLEVEMVMGALLAIAAMACMLSCQQLSSSTARWYSSKRCWFIIGNNCLYMSLGQSMSAALTELVFGIGIKAPLLAKPPALFGTILWVGLIFIAPLAALHSWWGVLDKSEKIAVLFAYISILALLLCMNAAAFLVENQSPYTLIEFLHHLSHQILKPLTWYEAWDWDK